MTVADVSTSYVDHLHAEPSAPPTPAESRSRTSSPNQVRPLEDGQQDMTSSTLTVRPSSTGAPPSEMTEFTPLLRTPSQLGRFPPRTPQTDSHYLNSIVTNSPRHARSTDCFYIINDLNYHLSNGEFHLVPGAQRCVCVSLCSGSVIDVERGRSKARVAEEAHRTTQHRNDRPRVGRRRQIVGILVCLIRAILVRL